MPPPGGTGSVSGTGARKVRPYSRLSSRLESSRRFRILNRSQYRAAPRVPPGVSREGVRVQDLELVGSEGVEAAVAAEQPLGDHAGVGGDQEVRQHA